MVLNKRELSTVLAALRFYQTGAEDGNIGSAILEIADDAGALEPLNNTEIDTLCEQLNSVDNALELADTNEIEAARAQYQADDIKVDEGALAARGDETVWVQAWVLLAPVEA